MAFVAREQEAATLLAELDRACSGQGRVIVLAGEPGSGKSVLVRRLIERAEDHAARPRAVVTRCYTGDESDPFAPWRQLTSTYPTLESRLPQPVGAAEPAVQGIGELGRRAATVMAKTAADSPLIVTFEDIDFADESSLALVRALAQRVPSASLLLILTVNAPHAHTSAIAGWLSTVIAESRATVLELAPIRIEQIASFIDDVTGRPPAARQRVGRALARLSGGNLLVLSNLIAAYEAGEIDLLADDDAADSLPTSLGGVVAALAGRLPADTLDLLGLAAVAGEEIDLDMLADLRAATASDIAAHLDSALAMGLLIEDLDGTIRFRHGAFQQALARQQPTLTRRLTHAKILDWLRRQTTPRPGAIARHAERSGDLATAYSALLDAARVARDEFGYPEAAKLYQRALSIGERRGVPDEEEDNTRLAMADVLVWNDRARGIREIDRVSTRARLRGDALMLARAAQRRATMLYEDGNVSGCQTILVEAIPILRVHGDTESLAAALTYLGYCHGTASKFGELEKVANELLQLDDENHMPMCRAVAYQFLASLRVARGEVDEALDLAVQCVDITEALGRYDGATDYAAVGIVIAVLANLHEPTRVRGLLERGEELARLRSDRLATPAAIEPAFVGVRFLYGEWDRVRATIPTLQEMIDTSPRAVRDMIHNLLAGVALAEGRNAACEQELDNVAPSAAEGIGDHSFRTWLSAAALRVRLCLDKHDVADATAWADAIERLLEEREFVPGHLTLGIARGQIALARGDNRDARSIAVAQQQRARETRNQLALVESYLLESRALRAAGHYADAARAAATAVVVARQCELPYDEARAQVERARGLLASGEGNAAQQELDQAQTIFAQLGAAAGIREIETVLSGARPARPAGLTEREVEVLSLVAQGLSDRQIAEQLFISHRTVTTHVGNLLGKTQTANRTELAMWAVHNRIVGQGTTDAVRRA